MPSCERAAEIERALAVARELRTAAEETRRALEISRDLVRRSRAQAQPSLQPLVAPVGGPSVHLVDCLIQAYEAAEEDGDLRTRALLARVVNHVGHRIASTLGPRESGLALH